MGTWGIRTQNEILLPKKWNKFGVSIYLCYKNAHWFKKLFWSPRCKGAWKRSPWTRNQNKLLFMGIAYLSSLIDDISYFFSIVVIKYLTKITFWWTAHCGEEGMEAGEWGSWSYCIHSGKRDIIASAQLTFFFDTIQDPSTGDGATWSGQVFPLQQSLHENALTVMLRSVSS